MPVAAEFITKLLEKDRQKRLGHRRVPVDPAIQMLA